MLANPQKGLSHILELDPPGTHSNHLRCEDVGQGRPSVFVGHSRVVALSRGWAVWVSLDLQGTLTMCKEMKRGFTIKGFPPCPVCTCLGN